MLAGILGVIFVFVLSASCILADVGLQSDTSTTSKVEIVQEKVYQMPKVDGGSVIILLEENGGFRNCLQAYDGDGQGEDSGYTGNAPEPAGNGTVPDSNSIDSDE